MLTLKPVRKRATWSSLSGNKKARDETGVDLNYAMIQNCKVAGTGTAGLF